MPRFHLPAKAPGKTGTGIHAAFQQGIIISCGPRRTPSLLSRKQSPRRWPPNRLRGSNAPCSDEPQTTTGRPAPDQFLQASARAAFRHRHALFDTSSLLFRDLRGNLNVFHTGLSRSRQFPIVILRPPKLSPNFPGDIVQHIRGDRGQVPRSSSIYPPDFPRADARHGSTDQGPRVLGHVLSGISRSDNQRRLKLLTLPSPVWLHPPFQAPNRLPNTARNGGGQNPRGPGHHQVRALFRAHQEKERSLLHARGSTRNTGNPGIPGPSH